MADIVLTQGQFAKVDEEDQLLLSQSKWFAYWNKFTRSYYAARMFPLPGGGRYFMNMHRAVVSLGKGDERQVDHINHDTLDNRRSNLRICTSSQNGKNKRLFSRNKSGVSGVRFEIARNRWEASIRVDYKLLFLGRFIEKRAAIEARKIAEIKYFGLFAGGMRSDENHSGN